MNRVKRCWWGNFRFWTNWRCNASAPEGLLNVAALEGLLPASLRRASVHTVVRLLAKCSVRLPTSLTSLRLVTGLFFSSPEDF